MADYDYMGEEENPELRALNNEVLDDPDSFEAWEKLVRAAESLEGGLTRNSSPQSITSARNVYDRFLAKFPLFFGYWKKYADLEFSIAGTEAAELIYERGVASVTNSVDLWAQYCAFKVETSHDPEVIRELFERAADSVGLDFLAHPFWDKYLEFEERLEIPERIVAILVRIISIPMHQYARYFERFRIVASSRPLEEFCPEETLTQLKSEMTKELGQLGHSEAEATLRKKVDAHYMTIFMRCQDETTKRWTYEQEIKRPYFHVTELDDAQLVNWRKYLQFEETEGDYKRIAFLYERCIVAAAYYDEFWLRYIRWMSAQGEKTEEVRHIYQRAACIYAPICRPEIRLKYALFEEMNDRVDVAHTIYEAILMALPGNVEVITAWANCARRQGGVDAAVENIKTQIAADGLDHSSKAALVSELAHILWKVKGAPVEARQVFAKAASDYTSNEAFWTSYLAFETEQPANEDDGSGQYLRTKQLYEQILQKGQVSSDALKTLSHTYMVYLLERGTKEAAKEYMSIDGAMNGSAVSIPKK